MKDALDKLQSEQALAVLYKATTALSGMLTKAEVARVLAEQLMAALRAEMCAVFELSEDAMDYLLLHSQGVPESLVRTLERFSVETPLPTRDVLLTRRPKFFDGPEEWSSEYSALPVATGAMAALPLVVDDRVIGAVTISLAPGRRFSHGDREFVAALTMLCAQALERGRLYEAERDARKRAEDANLAKSQFLNVMSHELRTPLNAVIGYAELLLMQVRGPLTSDQQQQVEGIRASASHQLSLIEEILDYASIDAGKVELRLEPVNLAFVVVGAAELVKPQAAAKGVTLMVTVADDDGFVIETDAAKVRQIVLNLAGNAVKFTREGEVGISLFTRDANIVVQVQDTGPGMPAESLASIWQPFMQLQAQASSPYAKGTGLGLPIARALAHQLGGDLTVSSDPGRGSCFELSLPRTHP